MQTISRQVRRATERQRVKAEATQTRCRELGYSPRELRALRPWYRGLQPKLTRWTPAGPHRNCGDRGISPKLLKRA